MGKIGRGRGGGGGGGGGGGTEGDQDSMLVRIRRSVLKNGALFAGIVILEIREGIARTAGGGGVTILCVIVGAPLGLCRGGGWLP